MPEGPRLPSPTTPWSRPSWVVWGVGAGLGPMGSEPGEGGGSGKDVSSNVLSAVAGGESSRARPGVCSGIQGPLLDEGKPSQLLPT